MDANHTLDCIGLYCPMPILKVSQRIRELSGGEVLEILSDDRGIKSDMRAWCEKTGHEFLGLTEEKDEITVYVRKSPATG